MSRNEEALDEACRKVGRFLHDFALLEREVDAALAHMLRLKEGAADVVAAAVDFAKKVVILRIVALEAAVADPGLWGQLDVMLKKIMSVNEDRVVVAHSRFGPAANGAVQFRRSSATGKALKALDPLWSADKFEQSAKAMLKLRAELAGIQSLKAPADLAAMIRSIPLIHDVRFNTILGGGWHEGDD